MYRGLFVSSAVAAIFMAVAPLLPGLHGAGAQEAISLAVDADPATPGVQAHRTVAPGESFALAVVLDGVPPSVAVGGFHFQLTYDDTLVTAPEVADDGTALDDNPDANEEVLGERGWDCSILGTTFPTGDREPAGGPGQGQAFIACINPFGAQPVTGELTLATVRLVAGDAEGETDLSLGPAQVLTGEGIEMGSCGPVIDIEADCGSATIAISEEATASVETPALTSPQDAATATGAAGPATREASPVADTPTAIAAEEEGGGGVWPWPGVAWILLGVVGAAALVSGVAYLRSRQSRSPPG